MPFFIIKGVKMNNINLIKTIEQTQYEDLSIYIHIPFCESRCYYCDFYSSVINTDTVNKYINSIVKEISIYSKLIQSKKIESIFIGGGTPSIIDSSHICKILKALKNINSIETAEITIEMNPNSITYTKIKEYKSAGINRFSIGAQSFNNKILKSIGRIHKKEDIIKAADILKNNKIENFSFDFMLALPYQTMEDIKESINMIKILEPSHLSYYSLIIEDNTIMHKIYNSNKDIFPDEEKDRKMYHYVVEQLAENGYNQYEISNFSKKGFESVHNKRYWELKNYIGLGASSHSNINNIRFFNHIDIEKYIKSINNNSLPINSYEILSVKDRINEYMIMGLRMNNGINIDAVNSRFNIDIENYYKDEINHNLKHNLIKIDNNSIKLTKKGMDLSNQVEVDFIKL